MTSLQVRAPSTKEQNCAGLIKDIKHRKNFEFFLRLISYLIEENKEKNVKEIYPPLTPSAPKARATREVWGTPDRIRGREMSKSIGAGGGEHSKLWWIENT